MFSKVAIRIAPDFGSLLLPGDDRLASFGALLNGRAIRAVDNPNLAQLDDPALNDEIERLAKQPLDASTDAEYSALDRSVMAKAPWAPWGNRDVATFTSDRIEFDSVIFNPVMRQDYGSFALK